MKKIAKVIKHRWDFHSKFFRLLAFVLSGYTWIGLRRAGIKFKPPRHYENGKGIGRESLKLALSLFILPLCFALSIFYFVHPTFAQLTDRETRLAQFLAEGGKLETGVETVEGFSHGFYIFEGDKHFLTTGSGNDKQVSSNGEYIVWSTETGIDSKIWLYNVLSDTKLNLSYGGVNLVPKVSKTGRVVWESWVEDTSSQSNGNWQLFVYDGKQIRQITQGERSGHASIENDFIVYARRGGNGLWRSEAYSILEDKHVDIDTGNETEYPTLVNGDIFVGPPTESQKRYPLKVEDLFLVDLAPLSSAATTSVDAILKELELLEKSSTEVLGVETTEDVTATPSADTPEMSVTLTPTEAPVTLTPTP